MATAFPFPFATSQRDPAQLTPRFRWKELVQSGEKSPYLEL
jgi:hypothetical protein